MKAVLESDGSASTGMAAVAAEPGDWLWRAATGRNVAIAVGISLAIFAAFVVWAMIVRLPSNARVGGVAIRSPQALANMMRNLSAEARRYYLRSTRTLDLLFPIAYSLALSLAIAALLRALRMPSVQALRFVPFAGALLDYGENTFILLWASGKRSPDDVAPVLAVLSPAKWAFFFGSVIVIAALGAIALYRRSHHPT